jgi:hypothetical protein
MYHEYKQHTIKSNSQIKQLKLNEQTQLLNNISSDDVIIQTFLEENEFTFY